MTAKPTGRTIEDFADAYRSGASVVEVIRHTLADLDHAPRGVLIGEPLHERALADAEALDGIDPSGLPLYGVPFVVKDNIDVAGTPTTAGCPGYAYEAADDAVVVALLCAAGAIVVGKTNLDQFATGLVGTRSPYGVPPNAIDPLLVPGGSSSGSAVAVALGLVPFSLGTDTAGSGRVPAALNGIVGVKPTLGRSSTVGIVPAMRRLDCPSVFAHTVTDAAMVADVIGRHDPQDPFTRGPQLPPVFRNAPIVGVPASWPAAVEISDEMQRWYGDAVQRLAELGCEIRAIDIAPLIEVGAKLYGSTLVAERSASVGSAVAAGIPGLNPVVATIITRGSAASAIDAYNAEYELIRLRAAAAPLWDGIDVLALPTTPLVATLQNLLDDPLLWNEKMGVLTTFVNLLDLATIVVPLDDSGRRVPAGLQLIAPAWQDGELARLARSFECGELAPPIQACTLVVVGAHLAGLPLHHQLTDRRATFVGAARTTADYRLYALPDTVPPKPGLLRVEAGTGVEIEVEVWSMGYAEFGSFVDGVPSPLVIGTVELSDGSTYNGFLCEPLAITGAADISDHGGWRPYIASLAAAPA